MPLAKALKDAYEAYYEKNMPKKGVRIPGMDEIARAAVSQGYVKPGEADPKWYQPEGGKSLNLSDFVGSFFTKKKRR